MNAPTAPIIAIVGNAKTSDKSPAAAEVLGRELAKAGFRILVYASDPAFLECHVVRGYVASRAAARCSIQVRYPLYTVKPAFTEQTTNSELFDWRPDHAPDWEMSFYQSLSEVQGIILIGGGPSTLIAGAVARGHRLAMLALPGFGGKADQVWRNLLPGHDLPNNDELSLMAHPDWSDDMGANCVRALTDQLARKAEIDKQKRLIELRKEISAGRHAVVAAVLFAAGLALVPIANWDKPVAWIAIAALFVSPVLAGIAGATIRLVFDLRDGSVPLSPQSAITTGALGLIAGGVAGLLFITAQLATNGGNSVVPQQAARLVPFCFLVGFTAGMTLDAVFRKLIATDVLDTSSIEIKKGLERMPRLAVYFSQSWRARDVDLNLRVWSELAPKCELLVDEPKAASADPPYYINRIEELMRRADLFLAVLTLRPQASGPQCSPYMLFELRLAERVDLPRLVLYERETGFRPPQNVRPWECYAPFQRGENDSVMDNAEWEKRLLPQIRAWADWCERHRLPADYRASTTAVLLLGKDSEAAAIGEVRQALELYYDRILECDPATQTSDKVFRSLREAGLVATSDLSAPLYAAAHMTGIPAIRLVRGEAGTPLPWIVRFGPGGYEEDILYWTSPEGLAAKVEPRVQAMFRLSVAKSDGADLAYLMSKRYRDFLVFVSHNLKPPEDILVRRLCQMLQSKLSLRSSTTSAIKPEWRGVQQWKKL